MSNSINEKDYYKTLSPIGKPILDLLVPESCYREDCKHTIWYLEEKGAKFNTLNAIKYLWRLGQKDPDYREDLRKTIQYLEWERDTILALVKDLNNEIKSAGLVFDCFPRKVEAIALNHAENFIAIIEKTIATCELLLAEQEEYYRIEAEVKVAEQRYGKNT